LFTNLVRNGYGNTVKPFKPISNECAPAGSHFQTYWKESLHIDYHCFGGKKFQLYAVNDNIEYPIQLKLALPGAEKEKKVCYNNF
jgi:hypothetical protein